MALTITLIAALVALLVTQWLIRIAPAQREPSVVPITYRPGSAPPVPRVGGAAIFVAMIVAIAAGGFLGSDRVGAMLERGGLYGGILGGATLLLAVGLADDLLDLSPSVKLLAQGMAAMFAVSGGLVVHAVQLAPDITLGLGWVGIPITLFWIIAVTNAFNFIDGVDGLASSIGVVGFALTLISASLLGHADVVVISAALIGALIGFLRYNLSPARIYLGDCGSLLVGYLLACLSLVGATSASNAALVYVPIFALALPLLDGVVAIARRWLRQMPVWKGDHRHIHHRVLAQGFGKRRSVLVLVLAAAAFACAGGAMAFVPAAFFRYSAPAAVAGSLVLVWFGLRRLDYYEFRAVRTALRLRPGAWRRFVREEIRLRDAERELATARDLDDLRTTLDRCALAFGLDRIEISRQRPRRMWRGQHLDVAVYLPSGGSTDDWMLRVWYGEYDSPQPELVGRAAHGLAGACGAWLRDYGLLNVATRGPAAGHAGAHGDRAGSVPHLHLARP